MNFTIKQFESSLRRVVKDEISHLVTKKDFNEKFNTLVLSVDSLTKTIDSFLNTEWQTHLHDVHPRVEKRLVKIEKRLTT